MAASEGEGKGATFTVELPLEPAAARRGEDARGHQEAAAPSELDGVQVLLVEDDADTRMVLAELLRLQGARVAEAASTALALEQLRHARPDVLVSDIGMPGDDGYA